MTPLPPSLPGPRGHDDADVALTPPPGTTPPELSEVTRLLAIGAQTDPAYADGVIGELLDNSHRFAAPAYGYDAATVLGHALAARARRRARTTAVVTAGVLWFVFGVLLPLMGAYSGTGFWVATVLAVWTVWAANLYAAVLQRQVVTRQLRRSRHPGRGFDGVPPMVPPASPELYDKIRADQDSAEGVVYYGGYVPFVGAGDSVRRWSFACLLERAQPASFPPLHLSQPEPADASAPEGKGRGARNADPDPFTADELTAYMEERLRASLRDEVAAHSQRLRGLEVTRRFYAKALGSRPPVPHERLAEYRAAADEVPDHYNAAREYLCVRVGSWSQELVTSVFLNVDLKGRMLYTQFHGYHLMPIKNAYHEASRLRRLTSAEVWSLAWRAAVEAVASIATGVVWVLALPLVLGRAVWNRKDLREAAVRHEPDEDQDLVDWGARRSVREMASGGYRHFFQQMDDEKFIKIIERRTFEVILDFLEDHAVDTTEYRAQQNALNVGILQTGGGTIVNSASMAVGPQAKAS